MLPTSFFKAGTGIDVSWRCYLPPVEAASILASDAGFHHDMRKIPEVAAPIDATARPAANENFLLINAFAPATRPPLVVIAKRVADAGCNIVETRVSAIGNEIGVLALAQGPWDAIAKLETALARLERDEDLRLTHFRTGPKPAQTNLLPYVIEVVAADKPGILFQLAEFFQEHGISVEQLQSMRYRAMQTGADMFSAQITIGIPANTHIAALRDDFLEFCDGQNLDAIMDPVKF
jgi:glycine cleavage system transcriptional repressor